MTLERIGLMAKRHWEKHRPQMVKRLKNAGIYEKVLEEREELAESMLMSFHRQGVPHEAAWEIMTKELIYLPSEEEEEELTPDQMAY